jgi:hypothetical protein
MPFQSTTPLPGPANRPGNVTGKVRAALRRLVQRECALYADGRCLVLEDRCVFQADPAPRCRYAEACLLGLDPEALQTPAHGSLDGELAQAYRDQVVRGVAGPVRRCRWPGCRRELPVGAAPARKYCEDHVGLSRRRTRRESARRVRAGVDKLTSTALDE